ncbi:MAG: polysaccharide biosynthesis C-terminal domain-containing protein [Ignavibacteriaceae bacterium]|nr:polysaccharide biosynthesis C-terminal domain-containing protein [Ignavibacteriaceae bacterium]
MDLWLGRKFAEESSLVLQLLALGVLLNSFAHLPFTFLQGIGRPDIPAKINLIELPFYLLSMWFAIKQFGINGAALVWFLINFVNTVIQFFIVNKIITAHFEFKFSNISILIMILSLITPFIINNLFFKIIFSFGMLLFFIIITWRFFLLKDEKMFLISKIKVLNV